MPKSKKENIEEMTLDPIEEKVKDPAPVEEPVEEPETVEEGEDITEPDELIEPEEDEQDEDVEFDEDAGEETDEDAPEESAPPVLGLMLGAKNAPVSEDPDPQSRIEALLWHIINGTTTDAVPQSRNEAILTAIANSGTYTAEAQSRIEALLISILNHEESDITPISRNEAILKAIANSGEYDEEPQSRNEELLIEWLEAISIVIGTASGAVASFNTSLTEPLVKCECEFSASQASGTPTPANPISIDGVSAVQVTDCGKNLCGGSKLLANAQAYLPTGTTDTQEKTFTFGSAAQTTEGKTFTSGVKFKERTQYTIIITASKANTNVFANMRYYYTDGTYGNINLGDTIVADTKYTVVFYTNANKTLAYINKVGGSGATHLYYDECGVFEGTLTAQDFEAYNGTTAVVNLGGTYYGGKVDAVTGKITLTHSDKVNLKNKTWELHPSYPHIFRALITQFDNIYRPTVNQTPNAFCEKLTPQGIGVPTDLNNNCVAIGRTGVNYVFVRDDNANDETEFISNLGDCNFVYELATPIVVYASNTAEIPTLAGVNNCFCDTGDIEVEYKKRGND